MKKRFKYEKPDLVDFRADSAVGDLTTCFYGDNGWGGGSSECNAGSCVCKSGCGTGTSAQACTNGDSTCHDNCNCYTCCQSGDYHATTPTSCFCNTGTKAGWSCSVGNYASGTTCTTGSFRSCS